MSSKQRLQVGVVGAGIAGLAAAIALRRANCDVEVVERSSFSNEIGAAVTISPNSTRVLDHWGFDTAKAKATENLQLRMKDGVTLDTIYQQVYGNMEETYGHKNWSFHRVDLHDGLLKLATDPDPSKGPPAKVRLGTQITRVDCDKGEITTARGETARKDLVVIADGAHCQFIKEVTGIHTPMTRTGRSAFRCLIPFEQIKADPETWALFENQPQGFLIAVLPTNNVICVTYPCRNGEILNCAILHDTRAEQQSTQDWNFLASREILMECVKDMHPTFKKLLGMADEVKAFTLMHRPPLDRLTKGKAVLIGDAAHNMLPTHAQGAAVALEDSAALEIIFSDLKDPNLVEERLGLFEKVRLPRGALTQIMSNAGPGRHTVPEVKAEIRKFYQGPLPPPDALPYSEPFRDLFFSYDVFEEARKALI